MTLESFINLFMPLSAAIVPNCDYYQDVALRQLYYVHNPGYPTKYSGKNACRWFVNGPPNTKMVITCEDIHLPASKNCRQDRLSISRSGDSKFRDAHHYCGNRALSTVSESNMIAIGFSSTLFTSGGTFLCTLTPIISNNPTTTTEKPAQCYCGWRQEKRMVNGTETEINEFPLMAGVIDALAKHLFCGASIISNRYALTAAHCMERRQLQYLGLLVGEHDIHSGAETASAALYRLKRVNVHPAYNNSTSEHDIAVVRTENKIDFSAYVGPVCLPFRYSYYDFTGYTVTALGWGTTSYGGPTSDTLLKVNLTIITNDKCQKELTDKNIFSGEICTFSPNKDTCQFDSGGPILWLDPATRRLQLVGVISYGLACAAGAPSVNTRVTSYLAWMISVTSDAAYCIK